MAVPDFQSLMIPVLRAVSDDKVHSSADINGTVARELSLSEGDLAELLPSGRAKLFYNRSGWAKQYLIWAGLLTQPSRARYEITPRGKDTLAAVPDRLTIKYLERFEEFRAVQERSRKPRVSGGDDGGDVQVEEDIDPVESIEIGYRQVRDQLADAVLEQVKSCSPQFFERLVVDLLVAMGYGGSEEDAAQAVGGSGDGGIDGVIKEDRLGLESIYIQAKRWEGSVGRPVLQGFAGSLDGQRARKGVFITTSKFSRDALDYVDRIEKRIVLIDESGSRS
jgi:restriction system protein